jgi:hypothetical protein
MTLFALPGLHAEIGPDAPRARRVLPAAAFVFAFVLGVFSSPALPQTGGRTITLSPGQSFAAAVGSLQPGDTLIVSPGTYSDTSRLSIGVRGTAAQPVVVKGVEGQPRPVITRPATASVQNTINIEGATYLTLKGLEIIGNGGDGINMSGNVSFVTLEDLDIHDVDVGINFRTSMNNITARRNHIWRTGALNGTGEGMYVGCNDATCVVRDSLIEGNWIHDALPGTTQGDGIEVKVGSHSIVIRDNVIYNRPYPCIFVYGTGANPANLVEGNVVWNCLEGIYAVADAVVRNNIVIGSGTGLSLYSHVQVAQMKNVTAVNNTLIDNDAGLYVRWGSGVTNMVLANNAVYSPGKTAVSAGSGFSAAVTLAANFVQGGSSVTLDSTRFINGGTLAGAFVDAAARDYWPRTGSPLIGAGSVSAAPAADFNATARTVPVDVGAYETEGRAANPGWRIAEGFKVPGTSGGGGGGGGDTTPPTVALAAPAAGGAALSGTVSVTASASDNVAVVGVQFRLDGSNLGAEVTAVPYTLSWNTTLAGNGAHTLTAVARDAAGNTTTSAPVSVTVSNTAPPPPPPPASSPASSPTVTPTDGGGGGGCTIGHANGSDPTLPLLAGAAFLVLVKRRFKPRAQRRREHERDT